MKYRIDEFTTIETPLGEETINKKIGTYSSWEEGLEEWVRYLAKVTGWGIAADIFINTTYASATLTDGTLVALSEETEE